MRRTPNTSPAYGQAARAGAGCAAPVVGAVLALGLGWLLVTSLISTFDPIERSRREAQLYDQQALQDETHGARVFAARAAWAGAGIGGFLLLAGAAGVAVVMLYRRYTAWESIRAQHTIAHTRAATQLFPPGLESLSYHDSHRVEAAPALPPPLLAEQVEAGDDEPPTFAALLDSGAIGPGRPMLLGYDRDTGEPINGSWLDLYSTAVGGLSGSGKSWTATFLACQAALHGSRLLILDPHAESPESLAARLAPMRSRFICDPATTPAEMVAAVKLAAGELARRKEGPYTRGSAPIVVVADEFAALQRGDLAEPLAALVEALGQEGRKLDLFGLVCSQVWSAERAGGTPLRDSLASAYIHRLRPAQARMLSGLTSAELPTDLFTLPPGTAYLMSTSGELRPVVIPQMSPADVGRVAAMLGGAAPSAAPSAERRIGFRPEGRAEGRAEGVNAAPLPRRQDAAQWTPEEAAIVAALKAGKKPGELAEEMSGTKGGRKYLDAAEKIAAVIMKLALMGGA